MAVAASIRAFVLVLALGHALVSGGVALASERVALVIGNSTYDNVGSLANPRHDAHDIGLALARIGFDVTELHDLDARGLNIALRDFSRAASGADMAVAYFAGHGMEIDHRNYLIPVDAVLEQASDVTFEAVEMQKFLSAARGAKTLRLVLLDACRDNPFLREMADASTRSLGRGLGAVEPASGVLVGYSAKGGTVALDGAGRNSPYADALLAHLETPGLEVGQLFRRVRDSVLTTTNGQQEPFTYGSLPAQDIYLAALAPAGPSPGEVFQAFFAADAENSVAAWQAFIESYADAPAGEQVVARARQRLAALQSGAAPAAPAAPAPAPQSSPLIRACDQLAADPDDPGRPEDAPGVAVAAIDSAAAVTACTLAASGHPDNARSQYQLARALRAADRPEDARKWLIRAVEQGYPAATAALGAALLERPGGFDTAQQAVDLLDAAVAEGDAHAARVLGEFFTRPASSIALRGRQPLDYFAIAAAAGDPVAQFEAGYRLVSLSAATAAQTRQGIDWLAAAAQAGSEDATLRLAGFFLSTHTAPEFRDPDRGIALLTSAAANPNVAYDLGRRFRLGLGVAPDLERAFGWFALAARQGHVRAMVELGYSFERGRGTERDPEGAAVAYMDALRGRSRTPYVRRAGEWPADTARTLQRLLKADVTARYRGPIDGLIGGGTRAAMARLCGCATSADFLEFDTHFRVGEAAAR